MLHTANPSLYWVIVRIPGVRARTDSRPNPASIITSADTISAGGLFFDAMRWLEMGVGAILLSALLWLPLVRGITRSVSQMTAAAGLLAEGRFDVRVDDARRDELGSLGVAINRMATRLAGFVGGQKRFLGDIAHELCSPLARAQMALGILEQRGDETQLPYIADVREEIELMSTLVNELLSFSKAALGAQIKLESVALLPIVEKAAHRESSTDTAVQIDVAEDLRVMAEPELLLRSLANLVRNGIHYAGHAGPVVISATREAGKVVLKVSDSGPGVPPEALAQVFDPFYRVDPSRARETGGMGLGLAIVKTCAESCGGTVTARNGLPGLIVTITLQSAP
jgi:two-component system sensor histidine kinase CpxA